MITLKEAVAAASTFAEQVLDSPRSQDPRLEEVEEGSLSGQGVWIVTLSFPERPQDLNPAGLFEMPSRIRPRTYKTFSVAKETGDVLSMKIRALAHS